MKVTLSRARLPLPAVFIFCAGVFSIISFSSFIDIPFERLLFKFLTFLFLVFSSSYLVFLRRSIGRNDLIRVIILAFPFAVLFITDLISNPIHSLIPMLRLIGVFLVLLTLFTLKKFELERLLKYFFAYGLLVSAVSLLFFITDFARAEKFPIIDVYSNKSIVFEQNVFGIFIYFCVLFGLRSWNVRVSFLFKFALLLFGLFMSFYRTVYGLTVVALISRSNLLFKIFLVSFFCFLVVVKFELISNILKFEQISNLTGRTELWTIGLTGFSQSPFWGLGESSIPEYSNQFLHRDPPFTTYHNVFVDVVYSAGVLGLVALVLFVFGLFQLVTSLKGKYFLLFLLAPSLFNTFYPFAPNILGIITGTWIVFEYRRSKKVE